MWNLSRSCSSLRTINGVKLYWSLSRSKCTGIPISKTDSFLGGSSASGSSSRSRSRSAGIPVGQGCFSRSIHSSGWSGDVFNIQDEADFKTNVLDNKKPVIVEFHASWCGPCKLLKPRMEKSAVKFQDKIDLALVDIDDNPELAMQFSVGAVPSVLALKGGQVLDKFVGLKDEDQIETFINSAVGK